MEGTHLEGEEDQVGEVGVLSVEEEWRLKIRVVLGAARWIIGVERVQGKIVCVAGVEQSVT